MTPLVSCQQNLDTLGLFVRTNGTLLDLSSGYSFSLKLGTGATGFTTTTGFAGALGSGSAPDGVPNLVKTWATTGELLTIIPGLWETQLTMTRTSDGRVRVRQFWIRVVNPL